MKKIILFLIFIQAIFASSELLLPINEYKTDIYFGNGILTTEKEANDGLVCIALILLSCYVIMQPKDRYECVQYQYDLRKYGF